MVGRIANMVWKEAIQLSRYRLLLLFVLLFPVWNLTSMADVISQGFMHIPTAVYDQDYSPASRRLVATLRNSRRFDIDYFVNSQAELEQLLERGTVKAGLVIPHDFGIKLGWEDEGATAQVLLDGTETTTALIAQAYLEGAAYETMQRMLSEEASGQAIGVESLEQVEARTRVWFNEGLRNENFHLPAEMAGTIAILAILLPAVAVVREREMGTLEQLFVTPMRPIELIVGKSLLAVIVAYLGFLGMLAMNILYYRIPMRGSLALLMILTAYYIFIEMGWGLIISVVARTQGQAFLGAFFLVILNLILSGHILPVENMPQAVQIVSHLVANKHYNVIMQSIMLKGTTLADLWPQVAMLAVLGVALYTLAAASLRKQLE
jgi:ABC-2 type transport system permease protein